MRSFLHCGITDFRQIRELFQETDRQFQNTNRKIEEVSRLVGKLGNRLGDFVQEMVAPAVLRLFQERGLEVHQLFPNAAARREGFIVEVDLIAVNGSDLVAVECKSRLTVEDVDKHVERLGKIRIVFPQWAGHRIFGAVATMVLEEEARLHAEKCGFYVIAQSGDTVELRNTPGFEPKAY